MVEASVKHSDGVTVYFEAEDDDQLWQRFHRVFDGQWEQGYGTLHDFLEDHELDLR